jgi:hypothetical protein
VKKTICGGKRSRRKKFDEVYWGKFCCSAISPGKGKFVNFNERQSLEQEK